MRIIFMGTPEFAVPSLIKLSNSAHQVVAVVTAPDSLAGRDRSINIQSAVKKTALELNIPVLQPKNLKSEKFISKLKSYKPDIQVVVAFRMLPEVVWSLPHLGTINLHASLLPKYRGAAPIHWAIIKGETVTGLTTFRITHDIDTGDIIKQLQVPILDDDDTGTLHDRMMNIGAQLVLDSLDIISQGQVEYQKQNDQEATPAPKLFFESGRINFNQDVRNVYNHIRGLSPYPTAWCKLDNKILKIYKCHLHPYSGKINRPGLINTDGKNYLYVDCQNGKLEIMEVQVEGKKKMDIKSFLNGWKLKSETFLE